MLQRRAYSKSAEHFFHFYMDQNNKKKLTKAEEQALLNHVPAHRQNLYIPKPLLAVLIVSVFIVSIVLIVRTVQQRTIRAEKAANMERLTELRESFGKTMKNNLSLKAGDFPYYRDAMVIAYAGWEWNSHYEWNTLEDNVTVVVFADSEFDALSDREIHTWLGKIAKDYKKRIQKVYDEQLQDYWKLIHYFDPVSSTVDLEDEESVFYRQNFKYTVETAKNSYEYTNLVQDYYVLNGKDHFVRDEQSYWTTPVPSPTPTRKPSGSSGSSGSGSSSGKSGTSGSGSSSGKSGKSSGKGFDYYDAYKYDDPEDFWYDYEDDFEDYEDAEDYWEEYH